ncbi:MAG: hypothetical protein JW951_08425, partial [Lentisphaerae bacterium]|nr:hypothetical protein [Lentisphaerota bacterium]
MKPDRAETPVGAACDAAHGFSLSCVCWGYRDLFARTIGGLLDEGVLGGGREAVTREFFDFLKQADQGCFDHVLKEFLSAINPRTRWIMDLPGVFSDVVALGRQLAETKLHYGITYFRIWGEGGFGDTPREVRALIGRVLRLRETDDELAMAYLRGCWRLRRRLRDREVDRYLDEALRLYRRNGQQACAFLEGATKGAETMIRTITRECRLEDVQRELGVLLRALVGYEVEVDHLGRLDSDDLIPRGTSVVCMYRWLYVPAVIREFERGARNRAWYLLTGVAAAGMLAEDSFPRIHGHPEYRACMDLVGREPARLNLLQIVEYTRVIRRIRARWPGAA